MSRLLPGLLCFALLYSAPAAHAETLPQRIDRLQAAISAHKNQIATQEILIHFKEGEMDLRTESREVAINGNVVTISQTPHAGKLLPRFHDLPTTLKDPLHLLPNQFEQQRQKESGDYDGSLSIEGVGKTVFRLLRSEKIEGTTYDVMEFVQYPPVEKTTEHEQQELICTKLVCKLYIGSDGLIQRKSGVLYYREQGAGKASREKSATFESTRIEYRDPPAGTN